MKTKNKKAKVLESIETRTIKKFLLIVGIILFLMWVMEILFFDVFYENIRVNEIYGYNNKIEDIVTNDGYHEELIDYAEDNNIDIIIINGNSKDFSVVFSTYPKEINVIDKKIKTAFDKYKSETDGYILYQSEGKKNVVYFKEYFNNENYTYIYTETFFVPFLSTSEVFIRLLLLSSVIAYIIAVFFAYFLSKNISDPILNISKKARELVDGNLSISFNSDEYQEVKQLSDTLNYAINEIKKSQVLQKEVICNISHELKTPLTMIQSYAELISDINGDNKEKREQNLAVIIEEAKRLDHLVDDIMQYSKLESGIVEYEYSTFDLLEIIKKLEFFYKDRFSEKGFDFRFDYPDESVTIYADKNRIEQVIINLINNAINYSTDKKVIKVYFEKKDTAMRLVVRDYGMGIKKEDLENIFKKHFRTVGAKRTVVGSGIGLSICKSILDAHGYNYGVQSEVDKGSAFYVDFLPTDIVIN